MPKNRINFSNDFILKNEKIGINTDNPQALLDVNGDVKVSGIITSKNLNVTGNANFNSIGVGSDVSSSGLNVIGNGNFTGILTASQFSTGNIGSSININNSTITGPGEILIDPAPIGTNTGVVRIKGDLFIDGNTTSLSSAEVRDFKISIASSIASDLVLDSAGIGIGSTSIIKTFTWDYSSLSLKSSENINLAIGKTYKINGTDVLNSATLGSGVVNSSLTSVGTLNQLRVTGISTFTNGPVLIGAATSTGTALQPLQVTGGAYVSGNLGIGTTNPTEKLDVRGNQVVRGTLNVGSVTQSGTEILNIKQRGDSDGIRLYSGNNIAGGSVNPPYISFYRSIGEGLSASARFRIVGNSPTGLDNDGFSLTSPETSTTWIAGYNSGDSQSNSLTTLSFGVFSASSSPKILVPSGDISIGAEPSAGTAPGDGTIRSGQKYTGTSNNVPASNFTIQAGRGTGDSSGGGGVKGEIIFQTPQLTTSGSALQSYQTKLTIGRTLTYFQNSPVLIGAATSTGTALQPLQVTGGAYVSGNLGVGITNPVGQLQVNSGTSSVIVTGIGSVGIGTTLPQYKLHVVGDFGATTKSFSIPHPTKPGLTLRHGSLEGPENGVYVRGKTTESSIPLPDYWTGLVDEESISVNLTPKNGKLHSVVGISSNAVEIECIGGEIDCYFMILGERKDVAKLVAEY